MKIRSVLLWTLVLIAIDQATKLIIYTYFMECRVTLIPHVLEFKTVFNTQHSYVNVLLNQHFGVNMGIVPHLVIFAVSETIILGLYFFFRNRKQKTMLLDVAMTFQLASMSCALAGNLLWKEGTLDFLYLKPLFVFDLKDVYANCFVVLFFLWVNKHAKHILNGKEIRNYIKKNDIK